MAQDAHRLIRSFSTHDEYSCWQNGFWDKWFTSNILAFSYRPDQQLIDEFKTYELMATQTPEGYIGNYDPRKSVEGVGYLGKKIRYAEINCVL